ncbi:MAG: hypothetical protein C4576_16825 [Desulfobacteraceae bacterium]|nr:MAG: hypothetical protein C4576_16825 [Desulfobacteraceae bacterium]
MILNPAIIALIVTSLMVSAFALYASYNGWLIIRHWDRNSGSELQLVLERKTYLISTIFGVLLLFEFTGLFLFVYTADHIHDLFVGAMCAAGSLNVNDFGYPALVIKMFSFTLCGVWAVVNYADNRSDAYPMIIAKYKMLFVVTGALLAGTLLQFFYFAGMRADVITSCCGTLFSIDSKTITGELAALPVNAAKVMFFMGVALTIRTGLQFILKGNGAATFSLLASGTMIAGLLAVISFVSVHYYELPTHHCPFCLLQNEYHFVGYPLYFSLFLGGISGMGVGAVERNRTPCSSDGFVVIQLRLTMLSIACFVLFSGIAAYPMLFSDFLL